MQRNLDIHESLKPSSKLSISILNFLASINKHLSPKDSHLLRITSAKYRAGTTGVTDSINRSKLVKSKLTAGEADTQLDIHNVESALVSTSAESILLSLMKGL